MYTYKYIYIYIHICTGRPARSLAAVLWASPTHLRVGFAHGYASGLRPLAYERHKKKKNVLSGFSDLTDFSDCSDFPGGLCRLSVGSAQKVDLVGLKPRLQSENSAF